MLTSVAVWRKPRLSGMCGCAIVVVLLAICAPGAQQQPPPRIFFTDITSGPNTGGENNSGAFVTLYGTHFGAIRDASTVTIGGQPVARYVVWGIPWLWYQKIIVQLGPRAVTGEIVVHTGSGESNGI